MIAHYATRRTDGVLAPFSYFFGAYDVHADTLFGSSRRAKDAAQVLAFYCTIRRRYPARRRVSLVGDHLSTLERLAQSVLDRVGTDTLWEWEYTLWVSFRLAEELRRAGVA